MGLLKTTKMLLGYKAWADEITFESLKDVPDSELFKDRKTTFKNIVYTLNHIYVIDDIFKAHLSGELHSYTFRNTETCPTLTELWSKQKIMNAWYIDFAANISKKELKRRISFKYVGTGHGEMSVNEMILHIVNHGTYHRGFVSDMMYQIPAEVPTNDLTVYLRDVHQKK